MLLTIKPFIEKNAWTWKLDVLKSVVMLYVCSSQLTMEINNNKIHNTTLLSHMIKLLITYDIQFNNKKFPKLSTFSLDILGQSETSKQN